MFVPLYILRLELILPCRKKGQISDILINLLTLTLTLSHKWYFLWYHFLFLFCFRCMFLHIGPTTWLIWLTTNIIYIYIFERIKKDHTKLLKIFFSVISHFNKAFFPIIRHPDFYFLPKWSKLEQKREREKRKIRVMLLIYVLQNQTLLPYGGVWTTKKHPALFLVPFTSFWFGQDWPHHTVVRSVG